MQGQYRTIEAVIAAGILIGFLFFLSKLKPAAMQFKDLDVKLSIQKALEVLDENGALRQLAYANDTNGIADQLYKYVPKIFNYYVCIAPCSFTSAGEVYSVSYYLATNGTIYEPREVIVYAWE